MRSHIAALTEEPAADETGPAAGAGAGAAATGRDLVPTAIIAATGAVTTCELPILLEASLPLSQVWTLLTILLPTLPAVTVRVVPAYMLVSLRCVVPKAMVSVEVTVFRTTRPTATLRPFLSSVVRAGVTRSVAPTGTLSSVSRSPTVALV